MLKIKQRFSIKKFSIGVLSVGLAAVCYLSPSIQASDENSQTDPKVAESVIAHTDGSSESQPVDEDKPARDDTSSNTDNQIVETTISVDEEGNELARQEGTFNARNGDVEFNGKTYTHFSTKVDEATKTTKHVYTRVQTLSKDQNSNLLAEEDGRQDYKTGDVEFNGKYYGYVDSEVNKGIITHFYKLLRNEEFTFKHYLVNSDGTRVLHDESEYKSRDIDNGTKHEIIEYNGKTYSKDAGEIDYKNRTVNYNFIERKKVTKHVIKDTTEFDANATTTQQLEISENEHAPKTGIFESNGKYYKYVDELPNIRTFLENLEEIHYLEYEEVKNVTRHATPEGVIEIEENATEPKQGIVKFDGKEYVFDRTETADGITTHYYKAVEFEVPKDAPTADKGSLEITRFVTPEGEEVNLQEGALRVKGGVLTIKDKKYEYISTDEKDGIITHVVKEVKEEKPQKDAEKPQKDAEKPQKDIEKPQKDVEKPAKTKDAEKLAKSEDVKSADDQVKKLPNTGMTDNAAALGLLTLALTSVIRKRKSE